MNEVAKIENEANRHVAVATPMEMIASAVDRGMDVSVIEKLMALQERWEANQGRKAFDNAIADAKAEIPSIIKDREVDFTTAKGRTNYRYEDMSSIAKVVDPVLAKHGLSYRFKSRQSDGGLLTVTCILAHRDGHAEETSLSAGRDETGNKNNHQAVASAATYLQRYTLKLALGLSASTDDDGNSRPAERASEDQLMVLRDVIEAKGRDIEKLCAFYQVDSLSDLTAKQCADAIERMQVAR